MRYILFSNFAPIYFAIIHFFDIEAYISKDLNLDLSKAYRKELKYLMR
jgi:hypothetical protein